MIIERKDNEVIFRLSGDLDVDDLQDLSDLFEFKEISKKSRATQKGVDNLAKSIKKNRWNRTKKNLGL